VEVKALQEIKQRIPQFTDRLNKLIENFKGDMEDFKAVT
jgi:hypothetical protein